MYRQPSESPPTKIDMIARYDDPWELCQLCGHQGLDGHKLKRTCAYDWDIIDTTKERKRHLLTLTSNFQLVSCNKCNGTWAEVPQHVDEYEAFQEFQEGEKRAPAEEAPKGLRPRILFVLLMLTCLSAWAAKFLIDRYYESAPICR